MARRVWIAFKCVELRSFLLPSFKCRLVCGWGGLCSAELNRPFPGMRSNLGEEVRFVGLKPGSKCLSPFPGATTYLKSRKAFKGLNHGQDRGKPNL